MSMSTPLDTLGDAPAAIATAADEERVKRILAEMNAGEMVQAPPVPMPMQRVISEPPVTTSTGQIRMDPGTSRAHVIGNSQPTMADFQSMFAQASPGMAPYHGPAVIPGPVLPPPSKTIGWKTALAQQLRAPIAVAIIVFFLNLPVVTSMLSRYAAWMYLSSGEISIAGLLVKALLAGGLFVIYQNLAAQLDK
jgi:hypothetical protein